MYLSAAVVDSFPKVLAFALVAHVACQMGADYCGGVSHCVVVLADSLKFSSLFRCIIRRFFVFVIVKRFIATQIILFERNKMP